MKANFMKYLKGNNQKFNLLIKLILILLLFLNEELYSGSFDVDKDPSNKFNFLDNISSSSEDSDDDSNFDFDLISNDIEVVRNAIESGSDVNATYDDDRKETALLHAVLHNKIEIVKLLIQSKADVNAQSANGNSPIMIAAINNYVEIFRLLLKAGAKLLPNWVIHSAEIIELIEEFEILKQKFLNAAKNGDLETVMECIKEGINIDVQDNDGFTALIRACQTFVWQYYPSNTKQKYLDNKFCILVELLKLKPKIDLKDKVMKWTALDWAEESGNKKVVKLLKEVEKIQS
jgi:ankyrin repeat protein